MRFFIFEYAYLRSANHVYVNGSIERRVRLLPTNQKGLPEGLGRTGYFSKSPRAAACIATAKQRGYVPYQESIGTDTTGVAREGLTMKIRYWWSEDGEYELCDYQKVVTEQPCHCYHCDREIPAETTVDKLQPRSGEPYLMHEECGKKGIQFP